MLCLRGAWRSLSYAIGLILFVAGITHAQELSESLESTETPPTVKSSLVGPYFDPLQGVSANEIVRRARPDLRFARLSEEVAQAGLQLARAQAVPDLTPFTKYSTNRSVFEDTPVGVLRDRDRLVTFGVSVELPIFNRNQGGKEEAAVVINQARRRREFLEAVIRSCSCAVGQSSSRRSRSNTETGAQTRRVRSGCGEGPDRSRNRTAYRQSRI